MVIAHTPRLAGIEISHDGRLVRIDTGISRYYGGKLSYLEIIGRTARAAQFRSLDRSPQRDPEMALGRIATMLVALVMAGAASAQAAPKPLFAGSDVLRLTIRGPITQIARTAERSRVPRDAVLTVPGRSGDSRDPAVAARHHPAQARDMSISAAAGDVSEPAGARLAVRRPEAAQAGHALPGGRFVPAISAARIFRLPAVQSADAGQPPGAAGDDRLCR